MFEEELKDKQNSNPFRIETTDSQSEVGKVVLTRSTIFKGTVINQDKEVNTRIIKKSFVFKTSFVC